MKTDTIPNAKPAPESYDEKFSRMKERQQSQTTNDLKRGKYMIFLKIIFYTTAYFFVSAIVIYALSVLIGYIFDSHMELLRCFNLTRHFL